MLIHPDDVTNPFEPILWDATPGVCCAAFQLGACQHTEGFSDEDPVPYTLASGSIAWANADGLVFMIERPDGTLVR